jgi:hypothetical protein
MVGILPTLISLSLAEITESHLDNGVVITMKAGDVCVQRGTIHAWINPFDKPARVYFVLTGKRLIFS